MISYDYSTGHIERDFHFVKHGEICRLRDVPSRVGAYGCKRCPYHKGEDVEWNARDIEDMFFTRCNHPNSKDSEGSEGIVRDLYDRFITEALSAL